MARNKGIIAATAAGIRGAFTKKAEPLDLDTDLSGRRCLVTGANSGLGKGIAVRLAAQGAHVTMAGRTMDEQAREDIVRVSENHAVSLKKLDLASFESVLAFVESLRGAAPFDVVVLNAAVMNAKSVTTVDGLDEMTQVNFLSNVLLLESMLAEGLVNGTGQEAARIVVVSSEAHRWSEGIDLITLGEPTGFGMTQAMGHYSDTKFLMAAYVAHLARRLAADEIAVHALCPGAVNSNLARQAPTFLKPLLKAVFTLFFASPMKASRPVFHLTASPRLAGRTGVYFHLAEEKAIDARAASPDFGAALFTRATEVINRALSTKPLSAPRPLPWCTSG